MSAPRILSNHLGRTLAELREQAGLTIKGLGGRTQLDPSYLSRIELGQRMPSREVLETIANVLDLTTGDRQRLLHAGGYLVANAADHERVETIATLLTDPRVPPVYAAAVQAQLDAMALQLRTLIDRPERAHSAPAHRIPGGTYALPADLLASARPADRDRHDPAVGCVAALVTPS